MTFVKCLWWYNLGTIINKWSCHLRQYIHCLLLDPCKCLGLLPQMSLVQHIFYCLILMVGWVWREWLKLLCLVEYGKRGRDPPESEWEWWHHWYDHQDQMTYHCQKECLYGWSGHPLFRKRRPKRNTKDCLGWKIQETCGSTQVALKVLQVTLSCRFYH